MTIDFNAVFTLRETGKLPEDVLGKTYSANTGEGAFEVMFPIGVGARHSRFSRSLNPPKLSDLPANLAPDFWGLRFSLNQMTSVRVDAVAVTGRIQEPPPTNDPDDALIAVDVLRWKVSQAFHKWFLTAHQWLQVWTGYSGPRYASSTYRQGWVKLGNENYQPWEDPLPDYRESPALTPKSFTRKPATMKMLEAAFELASNQEELPLEWLTLLAALRTGDSRRAVIDAATAAEIAVSKLVVLTAKTHPKLHPDIRKRLWNARDRGLRELVEALDSARGTSVWTDKNVGGDLARPRNNAVHQGKSATDQLIVSRAMDVAHELIREYSPVKDWDGTGGV